MEEGKAELRAAIAASPQRVSNYMALCVQYEREKDWEQAKKLCEQAHEVDSNAPIIADELAFLYLSTGGDVNVALGLAQQAKQRLPNSPITADALGWAYYKLRVHRVGDFSTQRLRSEAAQKSNLSVSSRDGLPGFRP